MDVVLKEACLHLQQRLAQGSGTSSMQVFRPVAHKGCFPCCQTGREESRRRQTNDVPGMWAPPKHALSPDLSLVLGDPTGHGT